MRSEWIAIVGSVVGAAGCGEPREGSEVVPTAVSFGPVGTGETGDAPGDGSGDTATDDEPADEGDPIFDVGATPEASETGDEQCSEDVDVVFVMDVSTTMGGFISRLADEILAVDQILQTYDLPSPPRYGLAVFVDDVALLNAGAPYADAAALRDDFVQWSGFTASNQQVNGGEFNSTWPENSLDALSLAAAGYQWRPSESTLRVVIHTTDDTFWDGPTTGNGVPIVHGYGDTVDALQAAKIRVFAFTADIGGSCECEDVSMGWSTPYQGAPAIPEATDGTVFDIDGVLDGSVSLSDAITDAVESSICESYDPVG